MHPNATDRNDCRHCGEPTKDGDRVMHGEWIAHPACAAEANRRARSRR
jgi:hypothetical protein